MRREFTTLLNNIENHPNEYTWPDVESIAVGTMTRDLGIPRDTANKLWDLASEIAGDDPDYDDVIHALDDLMDRTRRL